VSIIPNIVITFSSESCIYSETRGAKKGAPHGPTFWPRGASPSSPRGPSQRVLWRGSLYTGKTPNPGSMKLFMNQSIVTIEKGFRDQIGLLLHFREGDFVVSIITVVVFS
jgi:hypothetical protein